MKVFIVFTAIFMMAFTCVVFQGDMNVYMHDQETIKMIAEEAACQAALCIDEEAYGMGIKKFDTDEADEITVKYIAGSKKMLAKKGQNNIEYSIGYEDDIHGFRSMNKSMCPAATVTVKVVTDDYFRLPFLRKESITRRSRYEIEGL